MTYTDSLWKDAPEGATHIGFYKAEDNPEGGWVFLQKRYETWVWMNSLGWGHFVKEDPADIHPRPLSYTPAAQLIDQYRKEHAAEIEADANKFLEDNASQVSVSGFAVSFGDLLDDAAFALALLERYLATERARFEGEGK